MNKHKAECVCVECENKRTRVRETVRPTALERDAMSLRARARGLEAIVIGAEKGLNEADRVAYVHLQRVMGALKSEIGTLDEMAAQKEMGR